MAEVKVALRKIFDDVDTNKDNNISVSELKAAVAGCDQFTEADLQDLQKACDADGDKKITYDEFEAYFTAMLSQ